MNREQGIANNVVNLALEFGSTEQLHFSILRLFCFEQRVVDKEPSGSGSRQRQDLSGRGHSENQASHRNAVRALGFLRFKHFFYIRSAGH